MILAVNIGNTNIRAVVRKKDSTDSAVLFSTKDVFDANDFIELIGLHFDGAFWKQIESSIVSSVVPKQTAVVVEAIEGETKKKPQRIDIRNCGGLDADSYNGILGEDRVVCCVGALQKFAPPFVLIDFGTATTVNVVNGEKKFLGGAILPGLQIGLNALSDNTAQLPQINISENVPVIGKNTEENILSGAVIGSAFAVEGYIRHVESMFNQKLTVVVTGGNAPLILPYCDFKYVYEPNLLFDGLFSLL